MGLACGKCDLCKNQEEKEITNELQEMIIEKTLEEQYHSENFRISQIENLSKKEKEVDYIVPLGMPSESSKCASPTAAPPLPEEAYKSLSEKESKQINIGLLFTLGGHLTIDLTKSIDGVFHNSLKVLELPNRSLYKGEFDENNLPHGRGIEIRPDGSKYIGYFFKGKIHGQGRLISSENIMSEGYFITQEGGETTLSGESSVLHGNGLQVWPQGITYNGNFEMGIKQGKGKLKLNDSEYKGNFENDEMCGYGIMTWKNGKRYEGEWKDGLMHGKGNFKWPNGNEYNGNYEYGEKCGDGVMKWVKEKKKYHGEWKNGKQNGTGKFTYFDMNKGRVRARYSLWEDGLRTKWLSPKSILNNEQWTIESLSQRKLKNN